MLEHVHENVPEAEHAALCRRVLLADERSVTVVDPGGNKLLIPGRERESVATRVEKAGMAFGGYAVSR